MTDEKNVVGLVVMLIVANIISNLVERLRTQADISTQRERRATARYRLREALAEAGNEGDIARVSEKRIEAEFWDPLSLALSEFSRTLISSSPTPLSDALGSIN